MEEHPLMHRDIWWQVLRCFPFSQAVDLDMRYGGRLKHDLLVQHTGLLNESSWMDAVETNSLGYLRFLIHYKISCPFWRRLVERAAALKRFEMLILLTSPQILFYGSDGRPFSPPLFRPLDAYFHSVNQEEVARFFLYIYYGRATLHQLVDQPLHLIQKLVRVKRFNFVRFIVPQHYRCTSYQPVEMAMLKEEEELALYLLNHMDLKEPPEDILIRGSRMGMEKLVKYVVSQWDGPLPHQAIVEAFEHGQRKVYQFLHRLNPTFCPTLKMILTACAKGKEDVIALLPASISIPDVCLHRAIHENGNASLVKSLHQRNPQFRITFNDFKEAVNKDSEDLAVYLYQCEGKKLKKKIDEELMQEMVQKNMRNLLFVLHSDQVKVYQNSTLQEAVKNHRSDLFMDMIIQGRLKPTLEDFQELWDITVRSYVNVNAKSKMLQVLDQICLRFYQRKVHTQKPKAQPNRLVEKCADLCFTIWQQHRQEKGVKRPLEEQSTSTDVPAVTKRSKNSQ